jgi:hypothetical protein
MLDACEVVTPSVEILVRYRNGVDTVLLHQRVFGLHGSVEVEFLFE